jgi:hypothetical protein
MTQKSLKLQRYQAQEVQYKKGCAVRLRVVVTDAVNIDANIFVYLRSPINPHTGETSDIFQTIASPYDMEVYPVDDPDSETSYPFYRTSTLELDFPSVTLADEAWTKIIGLTQVLITSSKKLDTLSLITEVTIGDASAPNPSQSLSDSTSV